MWAQMLGHPGCNRPGSVAQHATAPTASHLQDLVSFLDALLLRRAALLHPRHEDAHVVAPGQPQPEAGALVEADHPRVGAVPAGGGAEAGQWGVCREVMPRASPGDPPPPACFPNSCMGPVVAPQHTGLGRSRDGGVSHWRAFPSAHTRGPPCSGCWAPGRCRSCFAWGCLKGSRWSGSRAHCPVQPPSLFQRGSLPRGVPPPSPRSFPGSCL